MKRPAVFLDRDGILNELVVRDGRLVSPCRAEEFQIRAGAAEAVLRLRHLGCRVFVVTNQPDIARGRLSRRAFDEMTAMLRAAVLVDDLGVCPHDDADRCACRKPAPGMLLDMANRWSVDLAGSFVIGDSSGDVEAGHRAGCRTILVRTDGQADCRADWVVPSLEDAVAIVETTVGTRA